MNVSRLVKMAANSIIDSINSVLNVRHWTNLDFQLNLKVYGFWLCLYIIKAEHRS